MNPRPWEAHSCLETGIRCHLEALWSLAKALPIKPRKSKVGNKRGSDAPRGIIRHPGDPREVMDEKSHRARRSRKLPENG